MSGIKRGDLIKNVAKQTNLSVRRAKEVIKAAGITDVNAYPGRELTKGQQIKLIKNLPQAIKNSGYKVRGVQDEYRFRQKLKNSIAADTQALSKPAAELDHKAKESASDFLERVHQGPFGQPDKSQSPTNDKPAIKFERVPLSDNLANLESMANRPGNSEPIAPDIG